MKLRLSSKFIERHNHPFENLLKGYRGDSWIRNAIELFSDITNDQSLFKRHTF